MRQFEPQRIEPHPYRPALAAATHLWRARGWGPAADDPGGPHGIVLVPTGSEERGALRSSGDLPGKPGGGAGPGSVSEGVRPRETVSQARCKASGPSRRSLAPAPHSGGAEAQGRHPLERPESRHLVHGLHFLSHAVPGTVAAPPGVFTGVTSPVTSGRTMAATA